MLIFYAWVVLMAAVVLAVPIVHFIETKKRNQARAAAEPAAEADLDAADDEAVAGEAVEDADEAGDVAEFGEATPVGEDDFSAFEEEFK